MLVVAGVALLLFGVSRVHRHDFSTTRLTIKPSTPFTMRLRPATEDPNTLRGLATQNGKLIGVAVDPDNLSQDPQYGQVMAQQFNLVAVKDWLKLGLVRQTPYDYDFTNADKIVDYACRTACRCAASRWPGTKRCRRGSTTPI